MGYRAGQLFRQAHQTRNWNLILKILVTGAAGFLGSHLVEELSKQGISLRAAYRPEENFRKIDSPFFIDGIDLESFPVDLSQAQEAKRALQGCQILFHTDSFFSTLPQEKNKLYTINHVATRNLMEAALLQGVEKVIYTSGMETLSPGPKQNLATERDGVSLEDLQTDFEKSRYLGEREVLNAHKKGLPTVIVHPTICLGIRESATTPFGLYLRRVLQKKSRFYLDTGVNLIDVQDAAKGHLLAAKRGKNGARYLLANQNVFMLELLQNIQSIVQFPLKQTAVPLNLAFAGNFIAREILRRRSGIPNGLLRRLKRPLFFDSTLSREQLGLPQSNVWEALKRQIQDTLPEFEIPPT